MLIDIPSFTLREIIAKYEGYDNPEDVNLEDYNSDDIADIIADMI